MIILDANVWIAFFNKDDSQHKKAVTIFECIGEIVHMPEYVLIEILTILKLKVNKKVVSNFLEFLNDCLGVEIFYTQRDVLKKVMYFFGRKYYQKLSFVDQYLLYLSKYAKIITFDKALNRALRDQEKSEFEINDNEVFKENKFIKEANEFSKYLDSTNYE
ncbi:hypothetical protein A2335_03560 [Candidatus Peregrinibacteria bacterium RIFOXYB2_FULL_32_7]|nr:MAG: hypothetical protein A2335_03560 [Candidatus Peregrinibacteria bacterium RIFOXYB2_FULL_32_7]